MNLDSVSRFGILLPMKGYVIRVLAVVFAVMLFGSAAEAVTMARMTEDKKFALVPLADGFDYPVGKPNAEGYYKSRGLRLKRPRHLGEDWNGIKGGNSDVGDPVYTIGHGLVTYAADARGAWGKVVIVRHAFREPKTKKVLCCQTLYAHLNDINVKTGQLVRRGDQVGTIGTNRGMYPAHLHIEMHYNILVNTGHQGVEKNKINYGDLESFIKRFRKLPAETKYVKLPIGCFLPYKGTTGL